MTLGTILLIVLILLLIGAFPSWPHSRGWGYGPTSGVGLLLIIVIVLLSVRCPASIWRLTGVTAIRPSFASPEPAQ